MNSENDAIGKQSARNIILRRSILSIYLAETRFGKCQTFWRDRRG